MRSEHNVNRRPFKPSYNRSGVNLAWLVVNWSNKLNDRDTYPIRLWICSKFPFHRALSRLKRSFLTGVLSLYLLIFVLKSDLLSIRDDEKWFYAIAVHELHHTCRYTSRKISSNDLLKISLTSSDWLHTVYVTNMFMTLDTSNIVYPYVLNIYSMESNNDFYMLSSNYSSGEPTCLMSTR